MQKILLLFFLLATVSLYAQAQERLIRGQLKGDDGSPLPGVSILVKGTTNGTTTDASGHYQIYAPLGATLVFSFIGFTSREVRVTEQNSTTDKNSQPESPATPQPQASKVKPPAPSHTLPLNEKPQPSAATGVATLSDNSPVFVIPTEAEIQRLPGGRPLSNVYAIQYVSGWRARLRYGSQARNGVYVLDTQTGRSQLFQISLTSSIAIDQINRLPDLQNEFAQGRPQDGQAVWRGPETGEGFSWGPRIRNLEYDGQAYGFDTNGALTTRGNGNGRQAQAYSPETFFRNGFTTNQSLTLKTKLWKSQLKFNLTNQTQQKVIPNANANNQQWTLYGKRTLLKNIHAEAGFFYTHATDQLPNRGGNWARLMASVVQTPPTFDNANGLSRKQAAQTSASYVLPDGQFRSYSAGQADNPYAQIQLLPDRETNRSMLTHLNLNYSIRDFKVAGKGSVEKQRQHSIFGLIPGTAASAAGRLTERTYQLSHQQLSLTPSYGKWMRRFYFNTQLSYVFSHRQEELDRQDGFGFPAAFQMNQADSVLTRQFSPFRQTHELTESFQFRYQELISFNASNLNYFSNTYTAGAGWLPSAGIAFHFTELPFLNYSSFLNWGKLFANYSQNLQEAPLIYNQWQYNSTPYAAADYNQYTESREIVYPQPIKPEHTIKREVGLEVYVWNNRLQLSGNYFTHLTQDALVPVVNQQTARLENKATIENKGSEWSLSYRTYTGEFRLASYFFFHRVRPVVKDLYGSETRIPIAGFSDVSANLVKGQPYGVLMGTTWKRNENNQLIIGTDGFPLVDTQPRIIGNPNPQWTASTEQNLQWRHWSLNVIFDFRHGGQAWNGTQAALNYKGLSELTRQQRSITDYLFEGVLENGKPNSQAVDFANPAQGLEGNRWVRYGFSGVGEESIQKTSWIRLNELKISYSLSHWLSKRLPGADARIAFTGRNLWLWTPYTGVDPAATLFGYNTNTGLDLFNAPSLRSYGISLQVTL